MEMKKVYEEMLTYFKNATEADLKDDLMFLDSLEKTDVLAHDYVNLLNRKIEANPTLRGGLKQNIECSVDCNNFIIAEELYLAA